MVLEKTKGWNISDTMASRPRVRTGFAVFLLILALIPVPAWAELDELTDGPVDIGGPADDAFSPPGITKDWSGGRQWLAERGLTFSADLTNTLQSVLDGGFDETTRYLGSSELIMDVDTEKLGLWPGGFFRFAAEGRFGRNVLQEAGTLSPVNNDAIFPADPDHANDEVFAITEVTATQFLSPWFGLYAGLLNTTSGDANDFAGSARSNEHFQNLSFLMSPVSMRIVPSVTLGAGVVLIPSTNLLGTVTLMDTEESAGSNPFNTNDGWTVVTEWSVAHGLGGMPLKHVLGFGVGFDNDFFRFGDISIDWPPGQLPSLRISTKDESWAFWYNGQIAFWTDPDDTERKWGPFVRFGYADDETNPFKWNLAAGFGGLGVLDARPRDRFGIGYYHLEPSDKAPLPAFGIQEEDGGEVFYTVQVLRGVDLTADLQYIDTGRGDGPLAIQTPDNAWVGGLRLRLVF